MIPCADEALISRLSARCPAPPSRLSPLAPIGPCKGIVTTIVARIAATGEVEAVYRQDGDRLWRALHTGPARRSRRCSTSLKQGRRRRAAQAVSGVLVGCVCVVASGCSAPGGSAPSASAPATSSTTQPTQTPDPSLVVVPATANIFGAGHDRAPAPGGGGGGTLPPLWPLPSGAARIVTFPSVNGEVTPNSDVDDYNGPGGDEQGRPTIIESFGGISGIVHQTNGMFLVGVFLTDDEPADPAPARLDFTDNEQFALLEPEIGQTFFIGDGGGHRYFAPPGATRLFLGFADAFSPVGFDYYQGQPGYYQNNSGELEVQIDVSIE